MTHKQWLYRNNDIHYVSNGLTLKQHEELTAKIKMLLKTLRSALLRHHRHYMLTNFEELGSGPTLAHQVWVANMEMAISAARIVKANFCTQDTLHQLNIPIVIAHIQSHPPVPTTHATTRAPPNNTHLPLATPESHICHNCFPRTPYSLPLTSHQSSTLSHHPTLFPIFLRGHKIPRHRTPCLYSIFYPANAPRPYNKISAHLHHLHVQKKDILVSPGLA